MISKFAYVAYDQVATDAQNKLREVFKELEKQVLAGDTSGVTTSELLKVTPYPKLAQQLKVDLILAVWEKNLEVATQYLDGLYFVLGKQIRADMIERNNIKSMR